MERVKIACARIAIAIIVSNQAFWSCARSERVRGRAPYLVYEILRIQIRPQLSQRPIFRIPLLVTVSRVLRIVPRALCALGRPLKLLLHVRV